MFLTAKEKVNIRELKSGGNIIELIDKKRSTYQYEVKKISDGDYQVAKFAGVCIGIEYYPTLNEVVKYIEEETT